jgi:hypothetical protein
MAREKELINGADFSEPSIILSRLFGAFSRSLKAASTSGFDVIIPIR